MIVLCLTGDPHWETNDDVGMSMVAHGYGIAAFGSPQIMFSNVLWGYVIRSIPSVGGVLGYSLATMAALFVSAVAIHFFLLRLNAGFLLATLAVALLLARRSPAFNRSRKK